MTFIRIPRITYVTNWRSSATSCCRWSRGRFFNRPSWLPSRCSSVWFFNRARFNLLYPSRLHPGILPFSYRPRCVNISGTFGPALALGPVAALSCPGFFCPVTLLPWPFPWFSAASFWCWPLALQTPISVPHPGNFCPWVLLGQLLGSCLPRLQPALCFFCPRKTWLGVSPFRTLAERKE